MSSINEKLDDERFDKHDISWNEIVEKYNPDGNEEIAEEMAEWLSDSEYTTCDECSQVCNSESDAYWKGYDFVFTGEDKESIDCLCPLCYNKELSGKMIEAYLA